MATICDTMYIPDWTEYGPQSCGGSINDWVECDRCESTGHIYRYYDMAEKNYCECSEDEYNQLPDDVDAAEAAGQTKCKDDKCTCGKCNGAGGYFSY